MTFAVNSFDALSMADGQTSISNQLYSSEMLISLWNEGILRPDDLPHVEEVTLLVGQRPVNHSMPDANEMVLKISSSVCTNKN
jgi:hypothetical protein